MNQSQAIHPSLLSKDLEGVTQTHTYTEKPYSYFDPTHEEVIQHNAGQNVNVMMNKPEKVTHPQKTLTKVKSMPLTLLNTLGNGYHSKSGDNLDIKKPSNLGETANRLTKESKNAQFANFSPILNRAKSTELHRSFNTNLQSKEYIVHDFTINRTPKVANYDQFNAKGSSGYIDPVTFQSSFQQISKQNLSPFNKEKTRNQEIFNAPVPNVRMNLNEMQGQRNQSSFSKNSNLPPVNQGSRPLVSFQKPQNATYNSQQVIRSANLSGFENQVRFQSNFYDPKKQNRIQNLNSQREKISFAKIQNTQRLEEVEFQRPQFRKIYDNKDETFRTVGPQEDYYRQEKTTCSKILPVLGVAIFLVLLAGTLFGLGVMTGMIGSKNYLSGNEEKLLERQTIPPTIEDVYVSNEVETGDYDLTRESQIKDEVLTPTVVPPIIEKVPQQIPQQKYKQVPVPEKEDGISAQPVIPEPVKQTQTVPVASIVPTPVQTKTTQSVSPKPVEQVSQKPVEQVSQKPVEQVSQKPVETVVPVTIPETFQPLKQPVPQVPQSIEPQVIIQPQKPTQQIKPVPIQNVVKPQKVVEIKPLVLPTVQPVVQQPTTQPQKTTQQLTQELFQPTTQAQQTSIKPQPTKVQKQQTIAPIQVLPITIPSQTINEKEPVNPEGEKVTQPLTVQQAGKIVDIIIEENYQIIPVNVKYSLKKDILNEFEQVPVNFRDVPHVEKISYQHIQAIVKADPSHKVTLNSINYRHHEVQKI